MSRTPALTAALVVLALAIAPARVAGQRTRLRISDELGCDVHFPFTGRIRQGVCLPLLLEFENRGPHRLIGVVVECNGSVSAAFSVRGAGVSKHWMYLPMVGEMIWELKLSFHDEGAGRLLRRHDWSGLRLGASFGGGTSSQEVAMLVISREQAPTVSSDFCGSATLSVINAAPGSLPDAWIGFSPVDLVAVTHAAWVSPRMNVEPLTNWVAMGGTCLIVDAPADGRRAITRSLAEGLPLVAEAGNATVEVGMGQIMFVDRAALLQAGPFPGRTGVGGTLFPTGFERRSLHPKLSVGENPPFVPVLVLLVIFSVLVGPVGWWYLVIKKGRPLMYYAVAPLVSVCVVAVVITADILKHGVSPRAACTATELLDQRVKKRVTLSQFVIYCPFTLGRALRGEVGELPHFLSFGRDGGRFGSFQLGLGGVSVATTAKDVVYAHALPARQKAWYARQSIQLDRRRLDIWKEAGKINVENHIGAPLRNLVVCCEGEYAVFERLDEGQKAGADPVDQEEAVQYVTTNLTPAAPFVGSMIVGAREMSRRWQEAFESGANTYAALRAARFEELIWLDSARFSDSVSVIRGIY